jgi:hypothetical protein
MRRARLTLLVLVLALGSVFSAQASGKAKTFTIYQHPNATAAPMKDVVAKDIMDPATAELEAIINKAPDNPNDLYGQASAGAGADDAGAIPPLQPAVTLLPLPTSEGQDGATWASLIGDADRLFKTAGMAGALLFIGMICVISYAQYTMLRKAIQASEAASRSAAQAALAVPSAERAYLFLEQDVTASALPVTDSAEPAHFTIKFSLRNYGKTPAVIDVLQASGAYRSSGYPENADAAEHAASHGMVVGSNERTPPMTLGFNIALTDLQQAYAGQGQILFWGKVIYRDVFGQKHETAFCRGYKFEEKIFQIVQSDTLNYHS